MSGPPPYPYDRRGPPRPISPPHPEDDRPRFDDRGGDRPYYNNRNNDECTLCDKKFGKLKMNRKHCNLCGISVCGYCSNNRKRLSQMDKKSYRVCDFCDVKLTNIAFENMYK